MDSFVAIDFETATWGSACAIGLAHFEDGKKIDERYTLINPKIAASSWEYGAIRVHGIHPRDVVDAPTFADIWPELIHYAACYPLVAHNANFDMGVLRSELTRANLASPTIRYGCSMQLARSAWPKRRTKDLEDATVAELRAAPENHKLSTLSEFLSIELDHHNALSDAVACGEITVRAVEQLGASTLAAAYDQPRLRWGELTPEFSVAG
ncbi:MAG: 3'-5' exonuclease [Thermoleophilaceae bacterium]|nr:3'-5' exonuclease [Thermoleophilaceae bacterium]